MSDDAADKKSESGQDGKAEDSGETLACSNCGKPMPVERKELLGVTTCIACTRQKKKPIGVWDYPEGFHERNEGVGGLMILDDD